MKEKAKEINDVVGVDEFHVPLLLSFLFHIFFIFIIQQFKMWHFFK